MTTIVEVRADDAATVGELLDVYARSQDGRWDTPWTATEKRVRMASTSPYERELRFLARDAGGEPVGWGLLSLADTDNTDLAWVELGVVPERRGRGHGAVLLEHLLDLSRGEGRRTAVAGASWPVGEETSGGRRFLEAHGFAVGLVDAHRVLTLPVALDEVEPSGGYRLSSWTGRCPDAWAPEYAALLGALLAEAPSGDMAWEPEVYDVDRLRHAESELDAMARVAVTTVAVAPDGALAGHTRLVVPSGDLLRVFQWDTLVLPAHRGHRLGLAMKVRNLHVAAPAIGPRTEVHTWNAEVNGPMIDVNAAMGFELVEMAGEMQRSL
ncbi:GNAT family N-acetyltransferase [Solicola sp. PLA-1-18]|uniref:GNAT family N-acetyltransferase n=1 Tax=Solicola sp. PLA-1-18 TaxID=3380532 RepID=UPI003B75EBD3